MEQVLTVNAGSSSVKFQVFELHRSGLTRRIKGQMDGVGTSPRLRAELAGGRKLIDRRFADNAIADIPAAISAAGQWLREEQSVEPFAVGHRVVHGGPDYHGPVIVDRSVLSKLEQYIPLAPLHQANNLAPIRTILARFPQIPQVACFDTAFHRGHAPIVDHFAIPERLYAEGIRRYGFHGLSYEYIAERLEAVSPDLARAKVIVAHLGSGASMCALANGKSIESTMGFTALDGLPMGTRPGQIDPGVILYLIRQKGWEPSAVEDMLYRESGLKGMSGVSNDVRELEASTAPAAKLALDHFVYRIALLAGALAAALGGLDAFVFTAGIGENSATIRARVCDKLRWLGADVDPRANSVGSEQIWTARSRIKIFVLPTDEELMIARHTVALVTGRVPTSIQHEEIA